LFDIIFGFARISTKKQSIERQERNILAVYPDAIIIKETYTGAKVLEEGTEWNKLYKLIKREISKGKNVALVYDAITRMSRNADKGCEIYEELFDLGVTLIFINDSHINSDVIKSAMNIDIKMTNTEADILLKAVKEYMIALVKKQIRIAFEQSEKELENIHRLTKDGLVTAKLKGKQVGRITGKKYTTKKEKMAKETILKTSRDFSGTNTDAQVCKIAGISRNTYYKYKKELKKIY